MSYSFYVILVLFYTRSILYSFYFILVLFYTRFTNTHEFTCNCIERVKFFIHVQSILPQNSAGYNFLLCLPYTTGIRVLNIACLLISG